MNILVKMLLLKRQEYMYTNIIGENLEIGRPRCSNTTPNRANNHADKHIQNVG